MDIIEAESPRIDLSNTNIEKSFLELHTKIIEEIKYKWPVSKITGRDRPGFEDLKKSIYLIFQGSVKNIFEVINHEISKDRTEHEEEIVPLSYKYIEDGIVALAASDLTYRVPMPVPAEFSELCDDFNVMMETLQGTLRVISRNSQNLSYGSIEISDSTKDLAKRTENQASSLEETASALGEITGTVQTTALNAAAVRDIVQNTGGFLSSAQESMEKNISTMEEIKDSSKAISNIITTINNIASQTNILAVNANIEAARAGNVGSGFAVVANEVRALATRTTDAAREIRHLIGNAGSVIEEGVNAVARSQDALRLVVDNINRIRLLTEELAATAQQQATGLQQINAAVTAMDGITQQNAAMVEQSSATCIKMAEETDTLQCFINQFDGVKGQPPVNLGDIDLGSALIAHAEWKARLRTAIERHQTLDARAIAKDDCCMLGKWLYGQARRAYGDYPEVEQCRQRHAEFHRAAAAVAEVINNGNYDVAARMLRPRTPYAEASRATGAAIMKLKTILT